MKLNRLYLSRCRVLHALELDFSPVWAAHTTDALYAVDLLVGLNGSGKSTVLQAIAAIFGGLERGEPIPFDFALTYELQQDGVKQEVVIANVERDDENIWRSCEVHMIVGSERGAPDVQYFPRLILAFTSGQEAGWLPGGMWPQTIEGDLGPLAEMGREQWAGAEVFNRSMPASLEPEDGEASRYTLIRQSEVPLVVMGGLLAHQADLTQGDDFAKVLEHCMVEQLAGLSLRFRRHEGAMSQREQHDYERLEKLSTHQVCIGAETLLVFDIQRNPTLAGALATVFSTPFEMYKRLSRMQAVTAGPLTEVSLFLERPRSGDEAPPVHLLSWLSDGESSFLARMSLFAMLTQQDALILLDEPEVHFNDAWKREMLGILHGVLRYRDCHLLVTSHSTITLSDVSRDDLVLLKRRGIYTDTAVINLTRTLGSDPSDLLMHVFGQPHPVGERAVKLIQEAINQVPPQPERLRQLQDEVAPGYWAYRIKQVLAELGDRS